MDNITNNIEPKELGSDVSTLGFTQPNLGAPSYNFNSLEQDKKLDEVYNGYKVNAFFEKAAQENWVYQIANRTSFEPMEGFSPSFELNTQVLNNNKLPQTQYNMDALTKSNSPEEYKYQIEQLKQRQETNERVDKLISKKTQAMGEITGMLVSPEVVGSMGLGIAMKASSVPKIMGAMMTVEATSLAARNLVDPTMSTEDAATEFLFAGTAEFAAAKFFNRAALDTKVTDNVVDVSENQATLFLTHNIEIPKTSAELQKAQEALNLRRVEEATAERIAEEAKDKPEFMSWMKESQRRAEEAKKTEAKNQADMTTQDAKQAELDARIAREDEYYKSEMAKFERESKAKVEREIRNEIELESMIKRFETDPKYEASSIGSFLRNAKKQRMDAEKVAAKATLNSAKIDAVKTTIKSVEEKLRVVNSKIKAGHTNKSVMTRWQKEVDNLKNTLKQEKNKLSSNVNAKRIKTESAELRRLETMIAQTFDSVDEAVNELKVTFKSMDVDELKQFKESVNLLAKNNPEKWNAVKSDLDNLLKPKEGYKYNFFGKLNRKQKALVVGAVIASGSSLQASEGNDDVGLGSVLVYSVLALTGVTVLGGALLSGGLLAAIRKNATRLQSSVKASEYATSNSGSKIMNVINNAMTSASTRLTESYMPIAKTGAKAKELADTLLFSFEHGRFSAEQIKSKLMHGSLFRYMETANVEYKNWLKENNYSFTHTWLQSVQFRNRFEKEVSKAVELGTHESQAVKNAAKVFSDEMAKTAKMAEDAGVYGAKHLSDSGITNYFTRLWRSDNFEMWASLDKRNKDIIANAIADAIIAKQPSKVPADALEQATKLVNDISNRGHQGGSNYEDIFGELEALLKEGVSEQDVATKLAKGKDREGRLKGRINMDVHAFNDIEIFDGNGVKFKINMDDMVKRNAMEVLESYNNSMFGAIAVAEASGGKYLSRKSLLDAIAGVENLEARVDLEDIAKIVYGQPVSTSSKSTLDAVNSVRDLTLGVKLVQVAFSMVVEVGKALVNGGFSTTLRHLGEAVRYDKDDMLVRFLMDKMPLGTSRVRNSFNLKAMDSFDIADVGTGGAVREFANKLKENTILYSGMSHISDFTHRLTLMNNATRFAKFIETGKGLSETRLKGYGISDEIINRFKGKFTFKNGKLQAPAEGAWTKQMNDDFSNILFRMNQEISPEVTVGGMPLWANKDALGKAVSGLLSYSMNIFSAQGVRDMRNPDFVSLNNLVMTMALSYVGMKLRMEANNKAYDEEDLLYWSLLNLPQAGLLSSASGMLSPAFFDTLKQVKDIARTQ